MLVEVICNINKLTKDRKEGKTMIRYCLQNVTGGGLYSLLSNSFTFFHYVLKE